MIQNLGKLAGKTIFITGASRGIGKAIALKCAKDGANIVVAAKTTVPHPKLPGTIFTAAQELEAAGGKCLPCEVDIREEDQVKAAFDKAVSHFGGIDILVNNASAIQLTGTEDTPMKRFDLMMGVNMRGTYVCSKHAIGHLRKSKNPHILNISPPLSMHSKWFKNHVAYTMAKYGMSMCALGMAEELRDDGIAVNTLWPRTAIYTAAMEMLGGGQEIKEVCRKPEIVSDAAYVILTKDSRTFTANFCIDDDILRTENITDFTSYNYVDKPKLLLDFFLEDAGASQEIKTDFSSLGTDNIRARTVGGTKTSTRSFSTSSRRSYAAGDSNADLQATFKAIEGLMNEEMVKTVGGLFQFDLKDGTSYVIDLKKSPGKAGPGPSSDKPDVTMILDAPDFIKMFTGKLNPTQAFMTGKLKIKGDLALAMKLEKLLKKSQGK